MKKLFSVLFVALLTLSVFAVSYKNNTYQKLADEYTKKAETALDAGAYGYAMCSSYNSRPRPAEVMICSDGTVKLIRRRETFDDLFRLFEV